MPFVAVFTAVAVLAVAFVLLATGEDPGGFTPPFGALYFLKPIDANGVNEEPK